ncbi:MAG: 23S rRNA (adenine(2503)-C(2))-methyltransferase RlmN [Alphaproteobacteria bacterium]|nr:23S rRNA (adenine(2503)-C(2))-methyltransferase RlmN [Alphaproteobacteria bacterium]
MTDKIELIGLSKQELEEHIKNLGEPSFRAKQIWQWVYFYGETDFEKMTNLSKPLRQKLSEYFYLTRPKIVDEQISVDRTHKWLLEFADGQKVEMVYIPEEDRGAVCISTQVGCAMGCKFCHTGSQKLTRNLSAGEIVAQFMVARDAYNEWNLKEQARMLSNIVVMGMGEPFQNFDNLQKAVKILSDGEGIAISKRRITISTSGIVPHIADFDQQIGTKLAISLHAPNDELRTQIMPINKKYPLAELMSACRQYQQNHGGYITFEYLMLQNFNDTYTHAQELMQLMKKYQINAKFNLIAFNPWPGCDFVPSSNNRIHAFSQELQKHGFAAPIRTARGQDILAACGQLKSKKSAE